MDIGDEAWAPVDPTPVHRAAPPSVDSDAGPGGDAPDAGLACPRADGPAETWVQLISNRFVPHVVEICAGDTVVWENLDIKEHTVVTGTPEAPDGFIASRKFYRGETFSFTFTDPAEHLYFCSTHKKKMRDAQVLVR